MKFNDVALWIVYWLSELITKPDSYNDSNAEPGWHFQSNTDPQYNTNTVCHADSYVLAIAVIVTTADGKSNPVL